MAFWIYEKQDNQLHPLGRVRLAGESGLLANYITRLSGEDTPIHWEASPTQLMGTSFKESEGHILVIDMAPEDPATTCLYRVTTIKGVSQIDETDLVIAFRLLAQGAGNNPVIDLSNTAPAPADGKDRQLVEAFRLTGGTEEGAYRWARPKMDIGAAICPASSHQTEACCV